MTDEKTIRVFVTKYALTTGVFEAFAKVNPTDTRYVTTHGMFLGPEHYHETREEAEARVRAMLAAKRQSLEKALVKLAKQETEGVKWTMLESK